MILFEHQSLSSAAILPCPQEHLRSSRLLAQCKMAPESCAFTILLSPPLVICHFSDVSVCPDSLLLICCPHSVHTCWVRAWEWLQPSPKCRHRHGDSLFSHWGAICVEPWPKGTQAFLSPGLCWALEGSFKYDGLEQKTPWPQSTGTSLI